jgi:hypothetical protein
MIVNEKICFIENSNKNISFKSSDNATPSDKMFDRLSNFPPMNVIKNQNIYVTLTIGAFSTFLENNLVACNVYKKDKEILNKGKFLPFKDDIKVNNVITQNNPCIMKLNIGNNPSEDFDDLFEYPFEDISISLYDRRIPHYRQYVNAYNTHTLSQSISVLGQFEEINGEYLTEKVMKGMSGNISAVDARKRSINIVDSYDVNNNSNEPFLDYELNKNSLPTGLIKRNFKYETRIINGKEKTLLVIDENSFSYTKALTRTVLFYNEENMLIKPFNDSLTEVETFSSYITTSRGMDKNYLTDPIATIGHYGEID